MVKKNSTQERLELGGMLMVYFLILFAGAGALASAFVMLFNGILEACILIPIGIACLIWSISLQIGDGK